MTKQKISVLILCAVFALAAVAQTKKAHSGMKHASASSSGPVMSGSEKWMDLPAAALVGKPSVEMGGTLKIAILQGDPMTPGKPYTVRLSGTDGTKIAPHWHPTTENVTVIKGTLALGMGSKWDDAAMKELPVGAFVSAPAKMRHYAQCKGECVLQINGVAPLVVNFVRPDDKGAANSMK